MPVLPFLLMLTTPVPAPVISTRRRLCPCEAEGNLVCGVLLVHPCGFCAGLHLRSGSLPFFMAAFVCTEQRGQRSLLPPCGFCAVIHPVSEPLRHPFRLCAGLQG
eukprot:1157356-Pelagomonas_calceolata.AAC.9